VLGALLAWLAPISQRIIAAIMAFGSGVLISALSFELMDHAFRAGGFDSTSIGFLSGALVYTAANIWISRRGAVLRKRSGQNAEAMPAGTDTAWLSP
jgi:ZIP family zinc transporter